MRGRSRSRTKQKHAPVRRSGHRREEAVVERGPSGNCWGFNRSSRRNPSIVSGVIRCSVLHVGPALTLAGRRTSKRSRLKPGQQPRSSIVHRNPCPPRLIPTEAYGPSVGPPHERPFGAHRRWRNARADTNVHSHLDRWYPGEGGFQCVKERTRRARRWVGAAACDPVAVLVSVSGHRAHHATGHDHSGSCPPRRTRSRRRARS